MVESQRVTLSEKGTVLLLDTILLSDAGLYSCNGTNNLGTVESDQHIMLRVYCE